MSVQEPNGDHDWYSNETATLGDRLADARKSIGMTQAELAKRLGVKLKTLEGWENDLSEPRANRLSNLAGLLNVSFRWLLTGQGEGLSEPSDGTEVPQDVSKVLADMRTLQRDLVHYADRVGRMEKRLRQSLAGRAG